MPCQRFWNGLTQKALKQSTSKLETDFFESVYRFAYASGISLLEDESSFYRTYKIMIKIMILIFVSSELWYLFEVRNSLDAVISSISVITIHIIVMYRYKCMEDYKDTYNRLGKSMESPTFDITTPKRKKIYHHWTKMNSYYYKVLLILASCTLFFWYIHPLLDDQEYNLMIPLQLPFAYNTPERYAITYFVVLLLFHFISCFVVVNDLMMQTYLIHMICQFAVLSDCIKNIVVDCNDGKDLVNRKIFSDERFRQKYLQRLSDLVEQHKFILSNSVELRAILSRPMLGQLLASTTLICLAGYQVTATLTVSVLRFMISLMYLAYNMYGFYLVCRWCEEIKDQSEKVGQAVYFSGWEQGAAMMPGVRIRLMIVTLRASRPLVVTAGGLYDVSLMSYTTLVKTSYSALTILLRMRQR